MALYAPDDDQHDLNRRQHVTAQEPHGHGIIPDIQNDEHRLTTSDTFPSGPLPREMSATPGQNRAPKVEPVTVHPPQPKVDHTNLASTASPTRPAPEFLSPCALCVTRKGILKKVRFVDEACGSLEDKTYNEDAVPVDSSLRELHTTEDVHYESPSKPKSIPLYPSVLPLPAPPPPPPPPPPMDVPRPPTLFNNAIEGNEYLNAAALRLYTSFIDELWYFVAQQDEVIRMRLAVQEKRKELHRLREHVSKCDMMLINFMRERVNRSHPSDDHTMLHLFEASQAARDEIGPVESEYEPFEIMLGSKEHQLVTKYAELEDNFEHFFRLRPAPVTMAKESSEIKYEASSVASAADNNAALGNDKHLHGAQVGENVGIGQLPKYATQLLPDAQKPRVLGGSHRRNVSLGSSDIPRPRSSRFADEQIALHQSKGMFDFIGIWITDMTGLSQTGAILQEQPDDESTFSTSNYLDIPDALPDFMDNYPVDPGLEDGNPLLLLGESNEPRGVLSDYLVNFESTPDRVNRWILHQLRISPREIHNLHRCVADHMGQPLHGSSSVLKAWPHDGLGYDNSYHQGSIELEESI